MIYQTTLMMAPIMITIIIVLIIFWIIAIGLALWVYKDAKKRDMNATVWLLIVLVTGCIGCIIYVIVRE
ncbi:hypothetical protein LCGC14_1807040 [marine sediment metagenome]|uniref:Cardiolipin synthase N-terminal domain-containing protein n=1 Tax=marine sediment metagenome TaxID=412755 RepID=A0A0F9GMR4_9ZZZZ